jgi:acyl carrier protein
MTVNDDVRQVLSQIVDESVIASVGDADLIFEQGVIDSLHLIELIDAFETRFGIQIAPEELSPENFGSVAAMARFIANKRGTNVLD